MRATTAPALAAALTLLALAAVPAVAANPELLSRVDLSLVADSGGGEVAEGQVSGDGRYVVFTSRAPHLVPGATDENRHDDVFLRDRQLGTTILVSHAAGDPARAADGRSAEPRISHDGRFVAFLSNAPDLVAGQADTATTNDVFLFDTLVGETVLVSHTPGSATTAANGGSSGASLSDDGEVVVFLSTATNLVPGQVDALGNSLDVFRFRRSTGVVTLVSHAAGAPATAASGASSEATVDGAGHFIAFTTPATNVVAGQTDTNGAHDVFLYDSSLGDSILVSRAAGSATTTADGSSYQPRISRHGNHVVFTSSATDIVAGQVDTNDTVDVFQFRRLASPLLVSRAAGTQTTTANGPSFAGVPSYDGDRVAFVSSATNVVLGEIDDNGTTDVFVYNRGTGGKILVSHAAGATSTTAAGTSSSPRISDDGQRVAYRSRAPDLVTGQETSPDDGDHLFLWTASGNDSELVTHGLDDALAGPAGEVDGYDLSGDGSTVVHANDKSGLTADLDTNSLGDAFAYEVATGANELLTPRDPARPSVTGGGSWIYDDDMVSADGRFVVFESYAVNLVPGQVDVAFSSDVFLHDRGTGTTTLVSRRAGAPTTGGDDDSWNPHVSPDGGWVAFSSDATDLVAGLEGPTGTEIYLWQRATGQLTLVSHVAGKPALPSGEYGDEPIASADGRFVVYYSYGADLAAGQVDGNDEVDVFLYDRLAGTNRLVSHRPGLPGVAGDAGVEDVHLTPDGQWVTFRSYATDLAADDTNEQGDVFLWHRDSDQLHLVSHAAGAPGTAADGASWSARASDDGRLVAFASGATDLVAGAADSNGTDDVFLWSRATGTTTLVSHTALDPLTTGDASSSEPALSGDGSWLAFQSSAADLVPGQVDEGATADVFLFDPASGSIRLVSHLAGSPTQAVGGASSPRLSTDGRTLAFLSGDGGLVPDQADGAGSSDVFVFRRDLDRLEMASRRAGTLAHGTDGNAFDVAVSADGGTVVFATDAGDLVPGDHDLADDVFAFVVETPLFADGFESGDTSAW